MEAGIIGLKTQNYMQREQVEKKLRKKEKKNKVRCCMKWVY